MWSSLIFAPLFVSLLAMYSVLRIERATEFELIIVNLLFVLFILFPRLRSQLIRRRTLVNSWLRGNHWLRSLLQGGSIYMGVQLILVVPIAFVLLIELPLITINGWIILIPLAFISALFRAGLYRLLCSPLKPNAASVLSREWATYLFSLGSALILLYQALYADRPDLSDRSLQDALLFTSNNLGTEPDGIIGDLMFIRLLKETTFWWSITKLPTLLHGLPVAIIWLSKTGLVLVYSLYQLSVIYAFGQWFAGVLECTDVQFYHFIKGSHPTSTEEVVHHE